MKQQVFRAGGAIRPLHRRKRWNRMVFYRNILEPLLFVLCFLAVIAGVYAAAFILYQYT